MKSIPMVSVLLLALHPCKPAMALVTENVVVTGTYLPLPEALMTNPVFVIDRSRMEALAKASVQDYQQAVGFPAPGGWLRL
jgi:hypothetical protein